MAGWERHNAPNGEHIWCGDKHIADIVTDTDNPSWDENVNEIAKSAILLHNDPRYRAAPLMYEALIQAMRTFQGRGISENDPRYIMLRKAKAKAEGKV